MQVSQLPASADGGPRQIPIPEPLVQVTRGAITESRHRGHVVAVEPGGKIVALLERWPMQVSRNAVVDRRNKIGVRQWFALVGGDGNQWHFAKAVIEGLEIAQILPAVKSG